MQQSLSFLCYFLKRMFGMKTKLDIQGQIMHIADIVQLFLLGIYFS